AGRTAPPRSRRSRRPSACAPASWWLSPDFVVLPGECNTRSDPRRTFPGRPLQAEHPLGVPVKNLLHHGVGIAELAPFLQDARVRQAGVIAPEHDLVLEPCAHVDL